MKRISGSNIHKLMYIRSLTFRSFCSLKDTMDAITQGREFALLTRHERFQTAFGRYARQLPAEEV